jgi:RimJ/RimL family protein N-acetyltransferase
LTADRAGEPFLETGRTRLRLWRADEADRFLDTYSRWEVARWLGATPTLLRSREDAVTRIERWAVRTGEHPGRGLWAIESKEDGRVAGTVLLVPVPDGGGAIEIGWHLHPDSWGHGFATEAARAVLDRGFADGLDEAIAVVRPGNTASVAVCQRLGMEPLGTTDRYYGTELELFRLRSPLRGQEADTCR